MSFTVFEKECYVSKSWQTDKKVKEADKVGVPKF
jgi:hypothetical protein